MGGDLFEQFGFYPSCMPPEIYYTLKDRVQLILKHHFKHVAVAIEPPTKDTEGKCVYERLSALVEGTVKTDGSEISAYTIATNSIGAQCYTHDHVNDIIHMALPWPVPAVPGPAPPGSENDTTKQQIGGSGAGDKTEAEKPKTSRQPAIQVDLHILGSARAFNWRHFHATHNGFWTIMDLVLSPYGLSVTKKGLYLHIDNASKRNKNLGRVLMSTSPKETLEYLGLNEQKYWTYLAGDDLMQFAATCRFYKPSLEDIAVEKLSPLQKYWYKVFMPVHKDDKPGQSAELSRQAVVEDAKLYFGARFEQAYDQGCKDYERAVDETKLWTGFNKYVKEEALKAAEAKVKGIAEEGEGAALSSMEEAFAGEKKLMEQGKALGTYAIKEVKKQVKDNATTKSAPQLSFPAKAFKDGRYTQVGDWAKHNWRLLGRERKADEERQSREHIIAAKAAGVEIKSKKKKSQNGEDANGGVPAEKEPVVSVKELDDKELEAENLSDKKTKGQKA